MDSFLIARTSDGGGTFTRQDALRAGYSPAEISTRLASGAWLRIRRGRYAEAALVPDDQMARYALTCSVALAAHDGAVLSHRTAAVLHGLDLHPDARARALGCVELIVARGQSRRRPGVLGHDLPLAADETVSLAGRRLTELARTGVDLAAVDTVRQLRDHAGLAAAPVVGRRRDPGGRSGLGWPPSADRWPRKHHRRMHRAIAFADGLSESAGESLSRVALADRGVPQPVLQHPVAGYRSDFAWPWLRTLGEFDGRVKYTDRDVLWAEKQREDVLRDAGWEVVRWTWSQITTDPAAVARRLTQAFTRGGRRVG